MSGYIYFTSESVSEGHPDKMADQISDAILDEILKQDPHARVACETFIKTGMVLIGGEMRTHAKIEIEDIVRQTIKEIGYDDSTLGFDYKTCAVISTLGKQSPDIAMGIDETAFHEQGAGDQGIMFGYATLETPELMPAPILYAHRLMQRQAYARKQHILPWLKPDAKSQITFYYENGIPHAVSNIVLSTQHDPEVSREELIEGVMEEIIKPVIPANWCTPQTAYHINPTGRFVIGGPLGDCGLTGRKIIVDTYGGMSRCGGGAFSGKDPSKVDRSAAYAARFVAKNIVAAGLADKIEIQIAYAIGLADPTSLGIDTFGTNKIPEEKILSLIKAQFDLRPKNIIKQLDLCRPIYLKTAAYGHFGREEANFTWEQTPFAEILKG